MSELFEETPRWKGAPLICLRTNLPAFRSAEDALAFHLKTNPRGHMNMPWQCSTCGMYHYHSIAADPGGSTSGTTRTQKHYDD